MTGPASLSSRDVNLLGVALLEVAAQQQPHATAAATAVRSALVALDRDTLLRVAGFLALAALDGRLDTRPWLAGLRHRVEAGAR